MSFQSLNFYKIVSRLLYIQEIVILDKVNSTNQYLIDNILYLKSGTICLAEYQTSGRGRYGKCWISPISNNIYLSIYWRFLKNNRRNQRQLINMLGIVVSVVIGQVLQKLGVRGIKFKWPNDIYCNGGKLVGILVEVITKFCDDFHVVIGVGINITDIFNTFSYKIRVISLEEMGIFIDRNLLVANVINALYQSLIKFEIFGIFPFFYQWSLLDNFYSKSVRLSVGNQVITGIARGINYNGLFLLEHSGIIYSYSSTNNISLFFD